MKQSFFIRIPIEGNELFTAVLLPKGKEKAPTVIMRSPYVREEGAMADDEVLSLYRSRFMPWTDRGYAVVFQHCRGSGKSTGDFVPYIYEREDGLTLQEWVREQPFYNGEIFLVGASYTASLHYSTHPFSEDVKGAVFEIQDSERYRLWYRNGCLRKGHAHWHFALCTPRGAENVREDYEKLLLSPRPTDPFWETRFGGKEARDAVKHARIPILLSMGYNDYYTGGVFSMWKEMDAETRRQSALLVSPYNHGDGIPRGGLSFPNGKRAEQFGESYAIDWLDHIRLGTPLSFPVGTVTYYRTFEGDWKSDVDGESTVNVHVPLGEGECSFRYDPRQPTAFPEEGTLASPPEGDERTGTVYSAPFPCDRFVRGRVAARLSVRSSCEDSTFYLRLSLETPDGDYTLCHDITSILFQRKDYERNSETTLDFSFDEHAFLIKKGQRLRIDITGTDDSVYAAHPNTRRGEGTEIAVNTVVLHRSFLSLPTVGK